MTDQQINELTTIVSRFTEVKAAAKAAKNSINELKFVMITDLVSEEDKKILQQAQDIVERITSNTSERDAIKYFKKINLNQESTD